MQSACSAVCEGPRRGKKLEESVIEEERERPGK